MLSVVSPGSSWPCAGVVRVKAKSAKKPHREGGNPELWGSGFILNGIRIVKKYIPT
jgi:hypothetical protein